MLTDRAERYLETLDRVNFVPTEEIERILLENGHPCIRGWLDFHEKFAGYVEFIGQDRAVWGLAHESPSWMDPLSVEVEYDKKEGVFDIACADVHPSYNYLLSDSGVFWSFPSECFEIYVERKAVGYFFSEKGGVRSINDKEIEADLLKKMIKKDNIIVEATDKFSNYYRFKNYLVVENVATSKVHGWVRS